MGREGPSVKFHRETFAVAEVKKGWKTPGQGQSLVLPSTGLTRGSAWFSMFLRKSLTAQVACISATADILDPMFTRMNCKFILERR